MNRRGRVIVVLVCIGIVVASLVVGPAAAGVPEVRIDSEPAYGTLLQVLGYVHSYYVDPVPMDNLLRGAISGVMASLDQYSVYYGKQEYESFLDGTITGTFSGIGIHIDVKDGYITVVAPIRGTPAEASG